MIYYNTFEHSNIKNCKKVVSIKRFKKRGGGRWKFKKDLENDDGLFTFFFLPSATA